VCDIAYVLNTERLLPEQRAEFDELLNAEPEELSPSEVIMRQLGVRNAAG
jgi:hypothetical protein